MIMTLRDIKMVGGVVLGILFVYLVIFAFASVA